MLKLRKYLRDLWKVINKDLNHLKNFNLKNTCFFICHSSTIHWLLIGDRYLKIFKGILKIQRKIMFIFNIKNSIIPIRFLMSVEYMFLIRMLAN